MANGRLPASQLVSVDGVKLTRKTANAFLRMQHEAANSGIDLWIIKNGGYRSYATQVDMKQHPENYDLSKSAANKLAAPGYSTHGYGDRIDIGSFIGARSVWLLKNAHRFGFTREFPTWDYNHFKHDGKTAITPMAEETLNSRQRKVGSGGVNSRKTPESDGKLIKTYKAGEIITFIGYVRGDMISGNSVWFKHSSGAYFWSGGFTDKSVGKLPNLTPVTTTPPVVVPPVTTPTTPVLTAADHEAIAALVADKIVGKLPTAAGIAEKVVAAFKALLK